MDKKTALVRGTTTEIVQSFSPSIQQHWFIFVILAFSIFLVLKKFGVTTITGLSVLSISGTLMIYIILSVLTTRYLITRQGILVKKGPFSRKLKEISYRDIRNIFIKQGKMQRRFKIGNLAISTDHVNRVLKGVKNPQKVKELINREKASEYERRTLLRKTL
jgi:uncharacterized membrane protein YdbT with pleckstrin-like domain